MYTHSVERRWKKRLILLDTKLTILVDAEGKGVYLRFGIDFCRMLEQEIDYLDVSVVAAHM